MVLRVGLFVVAALLVGAHFYRAGNLLLVALCAGSPLLFAYKRWLSLIALQVMAYTGSGIWVVTAMRLIQAREAAGQPWTAAAVILSVVALFTLATGLLLNSRSMRDRYPR